MKKSVKIILIAVSVILVLFAGATWFYFWGTSFSGDLVHRADKISKPVKSLPALKIEPQGWPWWLGPENNDHAVITDMNKDWSDGLNKLWEVGYLCKGAKSMVWSCPVIQGNRLVVPGRDETHDYIFCLHPQTGETVWQVENPEYATNMTVTTPVIQDDLAFCSNMKGGGSILIQAEPEPQLLWSSSSIQSYQSNPIIKHGYIYCYSGIAIQNKGKFVCADLQTGETVWETERIGHGTSIYADGHIVCFDIKGNLFLVKPDPDQFILVTEFPGAMPDVEKRTWTKPVIAQDKLYLRHGNRLICYDLKTRG